MLHTIGKKSEKSATPGDLVAHLLECHARIRTFTALAQTIASQVSQVTPAGERDGETSEACQRVERYFSRALPLHVADEEESILPRLHGKEPELDAALAAMCLQHTAHVAPLDELLLALGAVRSAPGALPPRNWLGRVARELEQDFAVHLQREEEVIFPAIRRLLDDAAQAEIARELQDRRS